MTMRHLHLDEIEAMPVGETLWKPIRSTLGIEAFGINAYVADEAGTTLVPEHDETEAGAGAQRHQEVYAVLSGRATFGVDGREVDAPAGTLVFVDDPAARRSARAAEAGTIVLAIGGPVGKGYEVPPWEFWLRARFAAERGEAGEARAIAREGLRRYPGEEPLRRLLETEG